MSGNRIERQIYGHLMLGSRGPGLHCKSKPGTREQRDKFESCTAQTPSTIRKHSNSSPSMIIPSLNGFNSRVSVHIAEFDSICLAARCSTLSALGLTTAVRWLYQASDTTSARRLRGPSYDDGTVFDSIAASCSLTSSVIDTSRCFFFFFFFFCTIG